MTETTTVRQPSADTMAAAASARAAGRAIQSASRDEIERVHAERGIVAAAITAAGIARSAEQREVGALDPFDRAIEGQRARAARRWLRQHGRALSIECDADDRTIDLILALTGANT